MLHARIKQARLAKSVTQAEVARRVRVSQPTYQRWEAGTSEVPSAKREALAEVLGVPTTYLETGTQRISLSLNVEEEYAFYGFIAVAFAKGDPVLLPVTISEFNRFRAQYGMAANIIMTKTLDNRMIFIRQEAIVDVFFSSDDHDEFGPEDHYPDCLGRFDEDDELWSILENWDNLPYALEGRVDQEKIDRVIKEHQGLDELDDMLARSVELVWQFSGSGKIRRTTDEGGMSDKDLYMSVYGLHCNSMSPFEIDTLGFHRQIFVNPAHIDYIWVPLHRFRYGATAVIEEDLEAED